VDVPSVRSWLGYNLLYVVSFVLLAVVSVFVFEPVTTVAAMMQLDGPPDQLIGQALPMTAVFTLSLALFISWLYGHSWSRFAAILLTCVVLVMLLGLNVSVIGLVSFPSSSLYLVAEMFGLIVALNVVYVVVFIALAQKGFRGEMLSTSLMKIGQDNNLEIE
jgi:uncharacterized membrane protein YuzA (DUF378 family)